MNSIENEEAIRELDLMLGSSVPHSGACARDLQQGYRGDCVTTVPIYTEQEFVLETYHTDTDGRITIKRPKR